MKLSPSVRAKSFSAIQDIAHILETTAVHYHFNAHPSGPYTAPDETTPHFLYRFFKILFNIIHLHLVLRSSVVLCSVYQ